RNREGTTSHAGGPAWQARAVHALACGVATFGEDKWGERFRRAVQWADAPTPFLDVRAVHVLAVVEHWRATTASDSADRALAWSREIADHFGGSGLLNAAGVRPIHRWGHLQESALADAVGVLG